LHASSYETQSHMNVVYGGKGLCILSFELMWHDISL